MRILLISGGLYWSEGTIAKGIVEALPEHEVFFYSLSELTKNKKDFFNLINAVDVVHWLFNVSNLSSSLKKKFESLAIPQVASIHHVNPGEEDKIQIASKANLIHVVSSEWLSYVKKHTSTPTALASLGVSIKLFRKINSTLYDGKGPLRIGLMGSYPSKDNRKRIDVAIDTFKKLAQKHTRFKLVLQGRGWHNYFSVFEAYNIPYEYHKLTSAKANLHFFSKIHLYVCTSDFEGGPLPVLEALAAGIPVVSTKVGIAIDALEQGGGLLCDKGNSSQLAEAILQVKNNKDLYKKLSKETESIGEQFDWGKKKEEYLNLYQKAINVWEETNKLKWDYKNTPVVNAFEQRARQISYDDLFLSLSLVRYANYREGIKLFIKKITDPRIKGQRKKQSIKELFKILRRQSARRIKNFRPFVFIGVF